ncbi:hypothetical protein GGR56DRAFT_696097 [Xylariaceae sp. FL0804]|nr:hypothetical protein GGR56DRAFT_696097 [Xylariaceae sp. FL0804]
MAEEQKPLAVPEAAAPAVVEPETKPEEKPTEAPVATEPAAETATEAKTEETPAAAAATEAKKEEAKPIEAGNLEHKGAPANFPKNLMYSKNHFWFGNEALDKEKLATYLKNEKASDVAYDVVSWATETGKGLLFYGKESDKHTPHGAIKLSEATEPAADGANKFHFTSKGHKHTFKAPSSADRDSWVSMLKVKIAEAKEVAEVVKDSDAYKSTMESFKPTPARKEEKKEEKPAEVAKEEPTKEETPATEAVKEEDKKEEAKEEKKEEPKEEKKRSSSKKRTSMFGIFGKKDEAKKEPLAEDKPAEDKPAETTPAAEAAPAAETAVAAEAAPADKPAETTETPAEIKPTEEAKKEEAVETKPPPPTKRASLFGGLSFGKKKAESDSAPTTPAAEVPPVAAGPALDNPTTETAPVIPAVETTEPLSAEVISPANAPTETTEAAPATNGEVKKDMKSDKRKSSLPFNFGKKEKATSSDEEGEKPKSASSPFFSKLRQTVKGKNKPADKPAEETKTEETPAESEAKTDEEPKKVEEPKAEESAAAPATTEEAPAETPITAASAPVTAAA